jgi:hypothetical protein
MAVLQVNLKLIELAYVGVSEPKIQRPLPSEGVFDT